MTTYKTVPVPDRGIDHQVQPHAIDPRAWLVMDGFRTRTGTIRSFEGWTTLLTPALPGPVLGISDFFKSITLERFMLIATGDTFYQYDPILQVATPLVVNVNVRAEGAHVEFQVPAFGSGRPSTAVIYYRAPRMAGEAVESANLVWQLIANAPIVSSPPPEP